MSPFTLALSVCVLDCACNSHRLNGVQAKKLHLGHRMRHLSKEDRSWSRKVHINGFFPLLADPFRYSGDALQNAPHPLPKGRCVSDLERIAVRRGTDISLSVENGGRSADLKNEFLTVIVQGERCQGTFAANEATRTEAMNLLAHRVEITHGGGEDQRRHRGQRNLDG